MTREQPTSLKTLLLIAQHLNKIKFPKLPRPNVLPHEKPTLELVQWGIQSYSFPWIRHFSTLVNGIVTLNDAGNRASLRILGRSSYELCAHAYYVKKHIKQHLEAQNLEAAWKFLLPAATGSRYITELYPDTEELFPTGAHISKAVKCFREIMPKVAEDIENDDDYSYLSEFCHPNLMTFAQHYRITPEGIEIIDTPEFGAFGAFGGIAASAIQGLLTISELLEIGNERDIRRAIIGLLIAVAESAQKDE